MAFISLQQARVVLDAAVAAAAERGLANYSIVVTDAGGAVRASQRTDGAGPFTIEIAASKARTAIGFGRASVKLAEVFLANASLVSAIGDAVGGSFLPLGGGIVLLDEEGVVIGGAGVAGGAPDTDHAVVTAAVEAAGLRTQA